MVRLRRAISSAVGISPGGLSDRGVLSDSREVHSTSTFCRNPPPRAPQKSFTLTALESIG